MRITKDMDYPAETQGLLHSIPHYKFLESFMVFLYDQHSYELETFRLWN